MTPPQQAIDSKEAAPEEIQAHADASFDYYEDTTAKATGREVNIDEAVTQRQAQEKNQASFHKSSISRSNDGSGVCQHGDPDVTSDEDQTRHHDCTSKIGQIDEEHAELVVSESCLLPDGRGLDLSNDCGKARAIFSIPCENKELRLKKEKKAKKLAEKGVGWTTSGDMEGHVDIHDITEVLNYLGEKPDVTPKRKLSKKSTPKKQMMHAVSSPAHGSGSISSEDEMLPAKPRRKENRRRNMTVTKDRTAAYVNASAELKEPDVDDELYLSEDFKEVSRKKKSSKPDLSRQNTSRHPAGDRTMPKPRITSNIKMAPAVMRNSSTEEYNLTLNSFPVLVGEGRSQGDMVKAGNGSLESASVTTDDDRDSVQSQPTAPVRNSWANVASKSKGNIDMNSGVKSTNNGTTNTSTQVSEPAAAPPTADQPKPWLTPVAIPSEVDPSPDQCPEPETRMTRSLCIEFGTVSDADFHDRNHVQDILTHNYSERQTKCASKSGQRHHTMSLKSLPFNPLTKKGVEFLDGQRSPAPCNISFGFCEAEQACRPVTPMSPCETTLSPKQAITFTPTAPAVLSSQPVISSVTVTGNFDLRAAVNLLQKEWESVTGILRTQKDGPTRVQYWTE